MSGPGIQPRDLRVSDDERSHVLTLLEKATGRGLINLAEYGRRSELVVAARTRADLNAVLIDLPGLQVAGRSVDAAAEATARRGPNPGYSGAPAAAAGDGVMELTGWGSRSFKGHWLAPAHIVIGGFGAGTTLDFSRATLTSTQVTVEFRSNFGGSTQLILPRGGSVRFDGLSMRGGSVNNKIPPGGAGVLDLLLTGTKKGGAVTIRQARQGMFGR
ncbi:hypothetical protein ABIB25_004476 [Nakamurella sp. UYEF19]|uniref:DUF1707 SHOCT-like domain-containing protein n=1 Tax=Nakamurella sp. UYEF19 TaxID=1756392 RepID=UPI003396441C